MNKDFAAFVDALNALCEQHGMWLTPDPTEECTFRASRTMKPHKLKITEIAGEWVGLNFERSAGDEAASSVEPGR